MEPDRFVVDAQPLVAFVKREPGWQRVGRYLDAGQAGTLELRLTSVNAGEVLWAVERDLGALVGHRALQAIQDWSEIVVADLELAARAAWIKLRGGISYADCFAAALAHRDGIPVITGDPEFRRVEDLVEIAWIDRA